MTETTTGSNGRCQRAKTGYSLAMFPEDAQKRILDQKNLFCSRKECRDELGSHVLNKSMKLQCEHSMCHECLDIVKARPVSAQSCDSCQVDYNRELVAYGKFAKGSLDNLIGGNHNAAGGNHSASAGSQSAAAGGHSAALDQTAFTSAQSLNSEMQFNSIAPAISSADPSRFDGTSQIVYAESGNVNANSIIDVTKASPDEEADLFIGTLLARTADSHDVPPYNPEYLSQANKALQSFEGTKFLTKRHTATQLVDAGFEAKEDGGAIILKCTDCLLKVEEIPEDTNPRAYHRLKSPNCPYLDRIVRVPRAVKVRKDNVSEAAYKRYLCKKEETDLMEYICGLGGVTDDNTMYAERNRLKTFPNQIDQLCKSLARSGCHLATGGSILKCAFCGFQVEVGVSVMWLDGETVFRNHVKQNCSFLKGTNVNNPNIPEWNFDDESMTYIYSAAKGDPSQASSHVFPDMSDNERRFSTFDCDNSDAAELLADAGYFFLPSIESVLCFSCGFEPTMSLAADIWEIHAGTAPRCQYMLSEVGMEFIAQAVARNLPTNEELVQTKVVDVSGLLEPVFSSAFSTKM